MNQTQEKFFLIQFHVIFLFFLFVTQKVIHPVSGHFYSDFYNGVMGKLKEYMEKRKVQNSHDYEHYFLTLKDFFSVLFISLLLSFLVGFIFYDSFLLGILLFPGSFILCKKLYKKYRIEKRKQKLKHEFLYALILLRNFLRTGYSFENSIRNSVYELKSVFSERSDIYKEWKQMANRMDYGEQIESLFLSFSERVKIDEIDSFSEMIKITKRTGGKFLQVIEVTVNSIQTSFLVEDEIDTSFSSTRLEVNIMSLMPLFMLFFIRFSSPDLLLVMYETLLGRFFMTVNLLLYLLAIFFARFLMKK